MPTPPPRTPLRRVSHGSLLALSRSGHGDPDAPEGLGFLEPALSELADEAEALLNNVQNLKRLHESLETFNESFASWLYVMNMNALTTDWPQAPIDASFELQKRRLERQAQLELEARIAASKPPTPPPPVPESEKSMIEGDSTFAPNTTIVSGIKSGPSAGKKVIKGKAKMSVKEKKERQALVDKVIGILPLAFRGSDPTLREHMEIVIGRVFDKKEQGVRLIECVRAPDLNEARVRKCLLALSASKIVQTDNSTGTVLYHWQGVPSK